MEQKVLISLPLSDLQTVIIDCVNVCLKNHNRLSNTPRHIPEPAEEFLSIEEAAKLLHLTVPTMYSKHSRGELPGVSKRGKRLYFSRKILLEWLEAGRQKTTDEVKQEAESFLNKKGGRNG